MDIFEHIDSSGDGMYLRESTAHGGEVVKLISERDVRFTREDVARLRDALTKWLGDERVREIVQDELRRIQVPGTEPIKARLLTEEEMHSNVLRGETVENIWGRPCATCGHSTGVHLYGAGCVHPGGCECTWADVNETPPAPKPASAPECVCPHRIRMHGPEGCAECKCTWTRSAR